MSFTPEEEAELRILLGITNKTVSDLELAPTLAGDMLMEVESGSGTFSSSINNLKTFIAPPATKSVKGSAFLSDPITIVFNGTTQMDIGAGIVNYDNGSGQLLCQAITKTLQASGLWTAGTNQNGLDTAPKANSTWYNIFEIVKNSDNTSDILYSLSRTAPTVPSGYTLVAWIGAIKTDASGNIDQNCLAKRTNYGQIVRFQTSDTLTGTGTIPIDDTVPQNTEGDEYMSLQITPLSATSRIQVEANLKIVNSAVNRVASALFRDTTANAIDADFRYQAGASNEPHNLILKTLTSSNSTSSTTFKVRAGGGTAGTTRMNGFYTTRVFGGVCFSSITINEIL